MDKYRMIREIAVLCAIFLLTVGTTWAEGKKYGLFVGINDYRGEQRALLNSVNDATMIRDVLIAGFGLREKNTTLLTDAAATREKIRSGIMGYQQDIAPGDVFVFYYSGHGTRFPDKYSEQWDEIKFVPSEDGRFKRTSEQNDSAIVPFDAKSTVSGKQWRGLILDDEFYDLFEGFTKKGARVVFISDSCHSGTLAKSAVDTDPNTGKPYDLHLKSVNWMAAIGIKDTSGFTENTAAPLKPVSALNFNDRYLMLASAHDNESAIGINPKSGTMSLFSYYLWLKLYEYGQAKKSFTLDAFSEVVDQVIKTAGKSYGQSQTPRYDKRFYTGRTDVSIF